MVNKKIIVTSDGESMESMVDQRFGRCKYFIFVEIENGKIRSSKAIENEGAIQGHGAGVKAAEQAGELEVNAVLTGNLGPNATQILDKLNIKVYNTSGTVEDAIDKFINGGLEEINEVAEPHSGVAQKENKGERIFFPLLDNNGKDSEISAHFGHAPFFGVYDVGKKELKIIENNLDHTDPNKSPIDQIEEAVNPTTIFAQGIGGRAIDLIAEKGMSLKTGNYSTVKEAIANLDKLEDQTQSCGHKH